MIISIDVWSITYKNRCREEKVLEAIESFRKPLLDIGIRVMLK